MIARTVAGWTAVVAGALLVIGLSTASLAPGLAFGTGMGRVEGQAPACPGALGMMSATGDLAQMAGGMMGSSHMAGGAMGSSHMASGMMGSTRMAGGMMESSAGCDGARLSEAAPIAGAPEVRVQARNFAFAPNEIRLPKGTALNLTLENPSSTGVVHDLSVPDLRIHVAANAGETRTVGLRDLPAGRYAARCTVPGHAELGMRATVIVE